MLITLLVPLIQSVSHPNMSMCSWLSRNSAVVSKKPAHCRWEKRGHRRKNMSTNTHGLCSFCKTPYRIGDYTFPFRLVTMCIRWHISVTIISFSQVSRYSKRSMKYGVNTCDYPHMSRRQNYPWLIISIKLGSVRSELHNFSKWLHRHNCASTNMHPNLKMDTRLVGISTGVTPHLHFPQATIITFPSFPTNLDEFCYWQFHSIFTLHRQKFGEQFVNF